MASPIPFGTTVRLQHDDPNALVAGPAEGPPARAGARLSAVGAGVEAGGVDRSLVVVMGLGSIAGFSTHNAGARSGFNTAYIQQIHAAARRQPAPALANPGRADAVPRSQHPGNGWQQTLPPFQRLLHRLRDLQKNCPVRHVD